MPQVAYTLSCGPKPWAVHPVSGTVCTVQVADPNGIAVIWSDGTTTTIPQGTQAHLLAGGPAVDTGANLYLIVAQQGSAGLTLVRLADALSAGMDHCLLPVAPNWGVLGELTHNRVREHPQLGDTGAGGSGLPPGHEGDLLYYHNGAWTSLAVGAANTVLTANGADPAYIPDVDLPVVIEMAHNDAVVGTRGEISLNDSGTITVTATDDAAHNKVDYSLALAPGALGSIGAAGPSSTVAYVTDPNTKCFSLYAGGGTSNPPPSGWQNPGFNDSAWPFAVQANNNNSLFPPISLTEVIWPVATPATEGTSPNPVNENALFRAHFNCGLNPTFFTVFLQSIDKADVYINGTLVGTNDSNHGHSVGISTFTPNPSLLVSGGDNVVAIEGYINPDLGGNVIYGWVDCKIVIDCAGGTLPSATEGDMLIFHNLQWALVPPPASGSGQKLTWNGTGTIPSWQ